MNAITRAISEIKHTIPPRVLDEVFIKRSQRWRDAPQNIDENIMAAVVRPRVLVDCNLVGGTEAMIPLQGIPSERLNEAETVLRFPKSATQNRSIMSVLNITFNRLNMGSGYMGMAQQNNSTLLQAGSAVMDVHASIPITSTANVQLIGENVVLVRDNIIITPNGYLRCMLGNDENLSHLQMRSYRPFSKLVELAVKAYIYNQYIVELDMGALMGGAAIGKIKDIIDGYADAEELYQTHLTTVMQKVLFMNDNIGYTRHLSHLIGAYR